MLLFETSFGMLDNYCFVRELMKPVTNESSKESVNDLGFTDGVSVCNSSVFIFRH